MAWVGRMRADGQRRGTASARGGVSARVGANVMFAGGQVGVCGMVYEWIVRIVKQRERDLRRGVFPREVAVMLPYYRAEQTLRKDMCRLASAGRLSREGGPGARRGYRVA